MTINKKTFVPGFDNDTKATNAGKRFYKKTNGKPGVKGVDFVTYKDDDDRWFFKGL